MGNRRVPSSDDEDGAPPPSRLDGRESRNQRKRKMVQLSDEEDEEGSDKPEPQAGNQSDEEEELEAQPLGEVIRVSGRGRGRRKHYARFEYDGIEYELEDSILLVPEDGSLKPYVAIIKDISQPQEEGVKVTGQWFYRPEEAEKKDGGHWQSRDTRELFYSFHRDEVPAESVMHKCVVHFIPCDKQIPNRKQHPGFVVQKIYDTDQRRLFKLMDKDYEDTDQRRLFKLMDKDYEDGKQHEINLLVQKTLARLGDLPDLEPDSGTVDHEDQVMSKQLLKKRKLTHVDVSRQDERLDRSPLHRAETPVGASEHDTILSKFKALTGETQRDMWLVKLLQSIQFICTPKQKDEDEQGENKDGSSDHKNGSHDMITDNDASLGWPDAAVQAVVALEKAVHDTLPAEQKYNQKMRQLSFNLKSNAVLARRLLNGELEPARIPSMLPNELKMGLTAEEIASREPEESHRMQMTDARCSRCMEKQVCLKDIIQAGHGYRYQLECVVCGKTWYASRDAVAILTIEAPSSGMQVGTAPPATAKFEDMQKNLANSREAEKEVTNALEKKRKTEACMAVLDTQRSFNKSRAEENPTTRKAK